MKNRIVLALGGNALQKGGAVTADAQKKIASQIGELVATLSDKYEIIITHGNGPQIGSLLLHEESAATAQSPAMPLETAVAMSQGQIGYWLTQAINNALARQGKRRKVATIVTQIVVDRKDPAFSDPTKPIGQFYDQETAARLARKNHWVVKEDAGRGWRRVVPSPRPVDVIEKDTIRSLVDAGTIVITAGGGGIPVYRTKVTRRLKGVDAVIDKDFASEKIAELTQASIFVSVTGVPNVYTDYGTPQQAALRRITASNLRKLIRFGYFKPGSMLPKVEAAIKFARHGGTSIITDITNLEKALQGNSGTIVTIV